MQFVKTLAKRSSLLWLTIAAPIYAQVPAKVDEGIKAAQTGGSDNLLDVVQKIINTLLLLVGILSVIMLVVGGIRYVTSAGNQDQVQGAKNTIVYALLGLVIAILAYAIVNFITGQLGDSTTSSSLIRLI